MHETLLSQQVVMDKETSQGRIGGTNHVITALDGDQGVFGHIEFHFSSLVLVRKSGIGRRFGSMALREGTFSHENCAILREGGFFVLRFRHVWRTMRSKTYSEHCPFGCFIGSSHFSVTLHTNGFSWSVIRDGKVPVRDHRSFLIAFGTTFLVGASDMPKDDVT